MNKIRTPLLALLIAALPAVRAAADACYVDVLFALDKKAVEYLADTKGTNVNDYVAQQLVIMNQVLENSGLADKFQFRSAGTYELGFEARQVDTSKELTRDVLENATAGKGMWEDLHTERDNRGADVVSVLIDTGSEYGHAGDGNSLTDLSQAASFGESAYSVASVRSTFNYYAILHEIGHNLGAGHALETSTADQSTAYSHGYNFTVNGQGYYTVMGYANNSAVPPTKAIPYFSTPDKTYLGVAVGTANRQDNVRVIEQTYQAASQWRTAPGKSHPTMSVAWNQESPMNDFSAMAKKDGSWQKAPCGCAATAAAQMFKHYAWPVRTDSVMEGAAHKYVDDTSYPFTLRFDGHNDFQWSKMMDSANDNDVVGGFETARMVLWCDAMAGMDFRVGDSSAQFDDIAENATQWFKKGKSTYYSEGDAYWKALTNALDRGELVQFTFTTHQVVADGYKIEDNTLKVHLNYGWADSSTRWYTKSELIGLGLNYIWTGFVPKKMAQLKPLPKQVSGSVPLSWTVPAQYADELTGFNLMGYYPGTTLTSYTGETGTMAADRAGTYFLTGAFGITANSTITYTLNSYHAQGIKVELQARFDAGEWETIATPEISTIEDSVDKSTGKIISGWLATTETVNLSSHANTTGEFRFKVSRTSKARSKDGQLTFAKPVWAKVYSPQLLTMGLPGYKSRRSYSFLASSYAGKVISFTAEPIIAGSVVCEPVATKVVSSSVAAQPSIVSIDGLSSEIENGFQRTCGIGKSVFFVKANSTTTAITASSSHLALVGDDDIAVTKVNDDTWAVIIDATGAPASSQLILTLIAEDALGNKAYKDLQLAFQSGEGGAEQEDTVAEAIASGNYVYAAKDTTTALDYATESRMVIGWGTVSFNGGVPESACGLNDSRSWFGRANFTIASPTEDQTNYLKYLASQNASASVYLNGQKVGDDPEPEESSAFLVNFKFSSTSDQPGWCNHYQNGGGKLGGDGITTNGITFATSQGGNFYERTKVTTDYAAGSYADVRGTTHTSLMDEVKASLGLKTDIGEDIYKTGLMNGGYSGHTVTLSGLSTDKEYVAYFGYGLYKSDGAAQTCGFRIDTTGYGSVAKLEYVATVAGNNTKVATTYTTFNAGTDIKPGSQGLMLVRTTGLRPKSDGTVVFKLYGDRAGMNFIALTEMPTADPKQRYAINFNVSQGSGSGSAYSSNMGVLTAAANTAIGEIPLDAWKQSTTYEYSGQALNQGTVSYSNLASYDLVGKTNAATSVGLKVRCVQSTNISANNSWSSSYPILNANLSQKVGTITDEQSDGYLTFTGIPYDEYEVYVYFSRSTSQTDGSTALFQALSVKTNDQTAVFYKGENGATVTATDKTVRWGDPTVTAELSEGVNYLHITGLHGAKLELYTEGEKYCGMAAVQIVGTYNDEPKPETVTLAHQFDFNSRMTSQVGGATPKSTSASYVDGICDKAMTYVGNSGSWYADSGINGGDGNWSVVLVAKAPTTTGHVLFSMGAKSDSNGFGVVSAGTGGLKAVTWSNSGSAADVVTATASEATSTYHFYVFAYDATNHKLKCSVDGADYTECVAYTYTKNSKWQIGGIHGGSVGSYVNATTGSLDELRVYTGQLSTDDIAGIMAEFQWPYEATISGDTAFSDIIWTPSRLEATADDDLIVSNATAGATLTFDETENTIGTLHLAGARTVLATNGVSAAAFTSIVAGSDTVFDYKGDENISVPAGAKATIPGWTTPSKITGAGTLAFDAGTKDGAIADIWSSSFGTTGTNAVARGTWAFTTASYPSSKDILISGEDSVLSFATTKDISYNKGGTLTVEKGGSFKVSSRDTFNRELTLRDGGKMLFLQDNNNDGRSIDMYTNAKLNVTGSEPSVIGKIGDETSTSGSGIIAIRRSGFTVTVASGAELQCYSQWAKTDGSGGNFIKTGAGKMVQYRDSSSALPFVVSGGTLKYVNGGRTTTAGITLNDGCKLELSATGSGSYTLTNIISGKGRIEKQDSGTYTLTGANTYLGATTVKAGTLVVNAVSALGSTSGVTVNSGATLQMPLAEDETAFAIGGEGALRLVMTEAQREQLGTITSGVKTTLPAANVTLVDAQGAEIDDREATIVDGKVCVTLKGGYFIIAWNGSAWTNTEGVVTTPTDKSILMMKDGDVVNYSTAVKPHMMILPESGLVKFSNQNNLGALAVDIPENTTLEFMSNAAYAGAISGSGTLKFNPGQHGYSGQSYLPSTLFTEFTGILQLASGRMADNASSYNANMTLEILDGAQLYLTRDITWSCPIVAHGNGWAGESNTTEHGGPLRSECNASLAASVTIENGEDVPNFVAWNSAKTCSITGPVTATNGLNITGNGGKLKLSAPFSMANIRGTVTLVGGDLIFGSGSAGSTSSEFKCGDKIVINSGRTFTLHTRTDSVVDTRTDNKAKFVTPIDLDGGTLHMEDGSYVFSGDVTVNSDSTMVFKWKKGRVFQSLKGSAVLNVKATSNNGKEGDGYAVFAGGDFSGTIRSLANSSNAENLYIIPIGTALAKATVNLQSNGKLKITEAATIGGLDGAKPITIDNGATATQTLTIASGGTVSLLTDTSTAAVSSTANLDLSGAVIDLNVDSTTPVAEDSTDIYWLAKAPSITTNGVKMAKGTWSFTVDKVDGNDVLKARKTAKGFYIIIADNRQVSHGATTKNAVNIDRGWIKTATADDDNPITDDSSEGEVVTALNEKRTNNVSLWENYVLGLEKTCRLPFPS